MSKESGPSAAAESTVQYSNGTALPLAPDTTRGLVIEAASGLGLRLISQEAARLYFRERLHGFSWPKNLLVSLTPRGSGTGVWAFGACTRLALPAGDLAHLKWLIDRLIDDVQALADEQGADSAAVRQAVDVRQHSLSRQRLLTLVQRVPVVLLAPTIVATFLSPRWLDQLLWLVWGWLAAFLVLGAETLRLRAIGAESLPYLVMTIAWGAFVLAFSLYYLAILGLL